MSMTTEQTFIYNMYRVERSPYTEDVASGLPNPTPLERGEGRFVQAQDQQMVTTRSSRIIIERLLTR